jgi:hypothetical protein
MNKIQFTGTVTVILGLILLVVFPIFGIFGEIFFEISFFGGWTITIIGATIILASLIRERAEDLKKEKFEKNY